MNLNFEDLLRVSHAVMAFSKKSDWIWKARPVLQFEFATIAEFSRAYLDLTTALQNSPSFAGLSHIDEKVVRRPKTDVVEIDCYGITVRLICQEVMNTSVGQVGVAQMVYTSLADYKKDQAKKTGGEK